MQYHGGVAVRTGKVVGGGPDQDLFAQIDRETLNESSQTVYQVKGTAGTEEELVLAVGIPVNGLDAAADRGLERNAPDAFPTFLFQAEIQVGRLIEEVGRVGAAVVYLERPLRNNHDGVALDGGDL